MNLQLNILLAHYFLVLFYTFIFHISLYFNILFSFIFYICYEFAILCFSGPLFPCIILILLFYTNIYFSYCPIFYYLL